MIKFVKSSDIFDVFYSDGTIRDSRVTNDDIVIIPSLPETDTKFKGHVVSGKSILVIRGDVYDLPSLDELENITDLVYAIYTNIGDLNEIIEAINGDSADSIIGSFMDDYAEQINEITGYDESDSSE